MRLLGSPLARLLGGPRPCARCGRDRGYDPTHVAAVTVRTNGHDTEWFQVCEPCGREVRRWLKGEEN